jgi:hypothetical protein
MTLGTFRIRPLGTALPRKPAILAAMRHAVSNHHTIPQSLSDNRVIPQGLPQIIA